MVRSLLCCFAAGFAGVFPLFYLLFFIPGIEEYQLLVPDPFFSTRARGGVASPQKAAATRSARPPILSPAVPVSRWRIGLLWIGPVDRRLIVNRLLAGREGVSRRRSPGA